jgi:hypothetical protein
VQIVEEKLHWQGNKQKKELQFSGNKKAVEQNSSINANYTSKETTSKHYLFDSIVFTSTVQLSKKEVEWLPRSNKTTPSSWP